MSKEWAVPNVVKSPLLLSTKKCATLVALMHIFRNITCFKGQYLTFCEQPCMKVHQMLCKFMSVIQSFIRVNGTGKNIAIISIGVLPNVKLYKKAGHNLMRLEQIYTSSLVSVTGCTMILGMLIYW